jgi:hypothetical protein
MSKTKNSYLKRSCPCCFSNSFKKNIVESPKKAENLSLGELKKSWFGFFKEKVIFSYRRCSNCELLYCPTFFTDNQLKKLYAEMPANMDEVPLPSLKKTQYGYFKHLKEHTKLNGEMLEIGPDIGLFTKNCVTEGNFSKFWLFEPNKMVKKTLEKLVEGIPSHVEHDMFNFNGVPDKALSTVVMIHVLDHLLDPIHTLKTIKSKLKENSQILVVTHDESSILRKIFGWRWPAFCLQHPQIYNKCTTKKLFESAGFEIITQKKTVNYFKVSFLFKHLLWALGFKVKSVPSFFNLNVGLKLGNILTIAKLKKQN